MITVSIIIQMIQALSIKAGACKSNNNQLYEDHILAY